RNNFMLFQIVNGDALSEVDINTFHGQLLPERQPEMFGKNFQKLDFRNRFLFDQLIEKSSAVVYRRGSHFVEGVRRHSRSDEFFIQRRKNGFAGRCIPMSGRRRFFESCMDFGHIESDPQAYGLEMVSFSTGRRTWGTFASAFSFSLMTP